MPWLPSSATMTYCYILSRELESQGAMLLISIEQGANSKLTISKLSWIMNSGVTGQQLKPYERS